MSEMDELQVGAGTAPVMPEIAEHGDVIAAAVAHVAGSSVCPCSPCTACLPEEKKDSYLVVSAEQANALLGAAGVPSGLPLTPEQIAQSYKDAVALWRPAMIKVLKTGLIFYNGLYPLDRVLLGVYDYLQQQAQEAEAAAQKGGK